MRTLTKRQKHILDTFIRIHTIPEEKQFPCQDEKFTVNHTPKYMLTVEDLNDDLYMQLMKINDTEILYQEIDRYLNDECTKIIHKK